MATPLLNGTELTEAITSGACRDCGGAGEIVELLGQDRVSGLIYDRTWPCHECGSTGIAPVYDDGLTDEQYEALATLEQNDGTSPPPKLLAEALHCAGLRSCQQLVAAPGRICLDCHLVARDAQADAASEDHR